MSHKWTRDKPLYQTDSDHIRQGETFEPTEAVKERYSEWLEAVESDDNPEGEAGEGQSDSAEDTPIEDMEYSELRQMAVDADTDEINGRSSKDEIIAYFSDE